MMRTNRPALCAERWIIPDTFSVDALIDAVLYEQAWWIAVQCGKYAHKGIVWAEGARRTNRHGQARLSGSLVVPSTVEEG